MNVDESVFLKPFFLALTKAGVTYAVMRNGGNLPETLGGSDLDLMVGEGDLREARAIALRIAQSVGGKLMGEIRSPRFCELAFLGNDKGTWWGAEIDICDGGYILEPLDGNKVLSFRERNRLGVCVLNQSCADLLGCGKELAMNGSLPEKYLQGARMALDTSVEECFSDEMFRSFVHVAVKTGCAPARAAWRNVRRHLMLRALKKNPIVLLRQRFGYYLSKAYRLVHPVGKFVAVMGTDGSGKSTLLDAVAPILGLAFHRSVKIQHLKPDFLPPLGRFRGVKYEPGTLCANPHGSRPSNAAGSLFRIAYLTADYVLGYWIKVRRHVAKLPVGLWVFDRYAYDLLFDPRRFRISLPLWIIRSFMCFVPKPEIVFCLGGDPEKIFARKPETSIEEVCRQVEALHAFAETHPNSVWIDTTRPLEESADEFLRGLMK